MYTCIYDSRNIQAEIFAQQLYKVYGWEVFADKDFKPTQVSSSDVFISLGGDGFLLYITHILKHFCKIPKIYPINYGTIGFLTNNQIQAVILKKTIETASSSILNFLEVEISCSNGEKFTEYALNDVSILRQTGQATHMKISVDGVVRMPELVADGILISTSAGSTAYNFSVGGAVFNINANLLSLQPVSPFRPRSWKGALLSDQSLIEIEMMQIFKRPVSANVDSKHFQNVEKIKVHLCNNYGVELLFDSKLTLEEKILSEQFSI